MVVSPHPGGVSSANQQYKLALNILNEHFGPVVQDIGSYILRRGRCTLVEIWRDSDNRNGNLHKLGLIKEALVILLQHNLLVVAMPTSHEMLRKHTKPLIYYQMDLDAVTMRLRFPKFLLRARQLFGEGGQAAVEAVMRHGRLPLSEILAQVGESYKARYNIATVADHTQTLMGSGDGEAGSGATACADASVDVEDLVRKMILEHYLVRVLPLDLVTPSPDALTSVGAAAAARGSRAAASRAAASAVLSKGAETEAGKKRGRQGGLGGGKEGDEIVSLEIGRSLGAEEGVAAPYVSSGGEGPVGGPLSILARKRFKRRSGVDEGHKAAGIDENGNGFHPGPSKKVVGSGEAWEGVRGPGGGEGEGTETGQAEGKFPTGRRRSDLEGIVEEDEEADGKTWVGGEESLAEWVGAGDEVLWRVGVEQFHRDLRHVTCLRFVRQKVNTTAESLVRAILQHSLPLERDGTVAAPRSQPLSLGELSSRVQLPPNVTVKMYLEVLQNDPVQIVDREGTATDVYCVCLGRIIESLRQRTLHSIIRERYTTDSKACDGDRNARICRVLLDKKYLDPQQVSELAMMSLRETRERLYRMYADLLLTVQEIPRRADHHPNQTFYLWTFNMQQVVEELTQRMYKGALNLRLRRQKETQEKRDLLANKENIRDDVEAAHFDQLTTTLDRLDQALENLDATLMLFTVF